MAINFDYHITSLMDHALELTLVYISYTDLA